MEVPDSALALELMNELVYFVYGKKYTEAHLRIMHDYLTDEEKIKVSTSYRTIMTEVKKIGDVLVEASHRQDENDRAN